MDSVVMKAVVLLLLCIQVQHSFGQGNVAYMRRTAGPNEPGGLTLDRSSVGKETDFSQGISFCARVKHFVHGSVKQFPLFEIGSGNDTITLYVSYKKTTLVFFSNFKSIVTDHEDSTKLWKIRTYQSFCFSYDVQSSHLMFVKVRKKHSKFYNKHFKVALIGWANNQHQL